MRSDWLVLALVLVHGFALALTSTTRNRPWWHPGRAGDPWHWCFWVAQYTLPVVVLWGHPWWLWTLAGIGGVLLWDVAERLGGQEWRSMWLRPFLWVYRRLRGDRG